MRCATLNLLGSCVTTGPYYRFRPPGLNLAAYRTGTSLVSLMAPPLSLESSDFESLESYQCRQLEGDVTKSSLDIVENDVDLYILDLGDETCDLVRIGNSYVTYTLAMRRSSFLKRFPGHQIIRRHEPVATRLWMEACTQFCRGPLSRIPQERIVFHQIQLAERCEETSTPKIRWIKGWIKGIIRPFLRWFRRLPPESRLRKWTSHRVGFNGSTIATFRNEINLADRARLLNPVLQIYSRHLRELLPEVRVVDVPARYRLADPHHRFGISELHYVESYDRWLISALEGIGEGLAGSGGRIVADISPR